MNCEFRRRKDEGLMRAGLTADGGGVSASVLVREPGRLEGKAETARRKSLISMIVSDILAWSCLQPSPNLLSRPFIFINPSE
jgi:hypothetical protein